MENLGIMIQYFWVLKAVNLLLLAFVVGRAVVVYELKSKLWNILSVILLVLAIVAPVKLSVATTTMHVLQDNSISASKVLIDKVENKSFSDTIKSLKGIQKEDIEAK